MITFVILGTAMALAAATITAAAVHRARSRKHAAALAAALVAPKAPTEAIAPVLRHHPVRINFDFIRKYEFPEGMVERVLNQYPAGTSAENATTALRQALRVGGEALYFGGSRKLAVPSTIVADLLTEFTTRHELAYRDFCRKAYNRDSLPEITVVDDELTAGQRRNLADTWFHACMSTPDLDPLTTDVAPELFRLDAESGIANAHTYVTTCGSDTCSRAGSVVCVMHDLNLYEIFYSPKAYRNGAGTLDGRRSARGVSHGLPVTGAVDINRGSSSTASNRAGSSARSGGSSTSDHAGLDAVYYVTMS